MNMNLSSPQAFDPLVTALPVTNPVLDYSNVTFLNSGVCFVFNGHYFVGIRGAWGIPPCAVNGLYLKAVLEAVTRNGGAEIDVRVNTDGRLQFATETPTATLQVQLPVLGNTIVPANYLGMELLQNRDPGLALSNYHHIPLTEPVVDALLTSAQVGVGNESLPIESGVDIQLSSTRLIAHVLHQGLARRLRATVCLERLRRGKTDEPVTAWNIPSAFLRNAMQCVARIGAKDADGILYIAPDAHRVVIVVKSPTLTIFECGVKPADDETNQSAFFDDLFAIEEESRITLAVTKELLSAIEDLTRFQADDPATTDLYLLKNEVRFRCQSAKGENTKGGAWSWEDDIPAPGIRPVGDGVESVATISVKEILTGIRILGQPTEFDLQFSPEERDRVVLRRQVGAVGYALAVAQVAKAAH